MRFKIGLCAAFVFCFLNVVSSTVAYAQQQNPVHFTANNVSHDETGQIITAEGDVELIQDNRILHADKITYHLQTDTVTALGNVSLLDEGGRVHFAEYLHLKNNMKDGFLHGLTSLLEDGSRFVAVEVERQGGTQVVMRDAYFTPCKLCNENPDKPPLWRIKADSVVYDEEKGSVKYKNARLQVLGVPVAYTPIFSHPDPRIKQRTGFLRPSAGWNSEIGVFARGGYYWGIDDDQDVTLSVQPTTRQGVLTDVEYRQNFANGFVNIQPYVAFQSDRTEEDLRVEEDLTRASIQAQGRFDINDKWRAGFDVDRVSDSEFLRLYDISNEDVLENVVFAERFSGRNYTNINAQQFQDVRLGEREEQPDIVPAFFHSQIGAPGSALGGRLSAEVSTLGLRRSDSGQDVDRIGGELAWQHNYTAPIGLVTKTQVISRFDYYNVRDSEAALTNPALDSEQDETRFFPQFHTDVSYPLVKNGKAAQYVIEPRVAFTAGRQIDDDIPNEDSQDIQLDALSLFETNRFPGEDVQDDGTRVTYGISTGAYGYKGASVQAFVGQSYRFDDDNLFPQGSGLENNASDYVGRISTSFNKSFDVDYRFQLSEDNLQPQRHEVQAIGHVNDLSWNARYTFARAIEGTGFDETREQLQAGGTYRLNDNWSLTSNTLLDLGEEPGLRRAAAGFLYSDECFNLEIQGTRRITDRTTGENETSLLVRLGFKYLGEFTAPQILINEGREE